MKKKILFIIWSYTYGGGAESLLTTIVNNLNPDKYDISIIEYEHAETKVEPVKSYIHVLPFIKAVDTPEKHSKTYQLYNTPEVLINTYIKRDYDLYISFNYQIPTFLLPRGTKNISWIHSDVYDLMDEKSAWDRKRQDNAFKGVNKIVAISDHTEKSLIELFPVHQHKIVKIYNGIDIGKVREDSWQTSEIRLTNPSILFVGRLEERKNPVRLVNVLRLVHQYGIKAHLYYLGNGELEGAILEQTERYNLSGFVHLLGYQKNPFPVIRQCSVTCLLSRQEGFSMSLLECITLNVPFIATEIGGARELSNGQRCGYIIDTDEEAARGICDWIKKDKAQIKAQCQESIKRFELKNYIEKIEQLFDSVIEEG